MNLGNIGNAAANLAAQAKIKTGEFTPLGGGDFKPEWGWHGDPLKNLTEKPLESNHALGETPNLGGEYVNTHGKEFLEQLVEPGCQIGKDVAPIVGHLLTDHAVQGPKDLPHLPFNLKVPGFEDMDGPMEKPMDKKMDEVPFSAG